jgi:O-antigen ligase
LYLLWHWRPWWILAVPVLLAGILLAGPEAVRTRVVSVFKPDLRLDSNAHRDALRRTGVRMIAANPLVGVGPEHVKRRFLEYVPPDIPKPLPRHWWYDHLHNIYLQYSAERGIPAMLALLWCIGRSLFDFTRSLRAMPRGPGDRRALMHAAVAVILGILVSGWGEHNLGDSEVLCLFLTMIGCGYVALDEPAEERLDVRRAA